MKLPSKTIFWYLIFLLIGFAIIFFDQLGWLGWFHRLTQPSLITLHSSTSRLTEKFNFSRSSCSCFEEDERIKELEKEVAALSGIVAQLNSCQEEIRASRRLLGTSLPPDWQFLPVKIFRVGESYFINQGKRMGIESDWPLVWENVYLGKVVEVQEGVSRIELVGQEGSKTAVKIMSDEGIQAKGILFGQGKTQAEISQILAQELVAKDDLVVTAGDIHLPPDLAIGKVKGVVKEKNEVYQKATVKLLVDPEKLETVFLITKR